MQLRMIIALGILIAIGSAYAVGSWRGHTAGQAAAESRFRAAQAEAQSDLYAIGEAIRAKAAAQRSAAEENRRLLTEIENEIASDLGSIRAGLSSDGMRRIERAFGVAD
jgi:hypothetical protein